MVKEENHWTAKVGRVRISEACMRTAMRYHDNETGRVSGQTPTISVLRVSNPLDCCS